MPLLRKTRRHRPELTSTTPGVDHRPVKPRVNGSSSSKSGEVSAPEAAGTLSPSDRLNSEIIGQSFEATERSIPTEDALRLVIDTTPALIHTGRPDGYLDYFNRGWLDFLGKSLEERCGWRWTDFDPSGRCGRHRSKMARRVGQRRTVRSRSACSTCRRNISYLFAPEGAAPRRTREHREMVWIEYRHRGPQACRNLARRSKHSCKPLSM